MGRYFAEMVKLVGGHEEEGREEKYGGSASAQGGANDQECRRQTSAQDHEA